jgi:hypothetical protein
LWLTGKPGGRMPGLVPWHTLQYVEDAQRR